MNAWQVLVTAIHLGVSTVIITKFRKLTEFSSSPPPYH